MSDPNEPPDSGDDRPPPPPPPPPPPEGGGYPPPPPPPSGGYPPPQQPPQQPPSQPYGQPQYGQPQYGQQQQWGQPYQSQYAGPPEKVPNYLVQSILVTLFCCLPAGIVAIVFAAQVNGKLESGDIAGARSASRNAKIWSWVSFGVGLFFAVGYIVLIIIAGVFGGTTSEFNGDF